MLDFICILCGIGFAVWNFIVEVQPPFIDELLKKAFEANDQSEYFNCFRQIYEYNQSMDKVRTFGFFVLFLFFFRLNFILALHPRLAILVDTLRGASDDLLHFAIYLVFLLMVLMILGMWSFGMDHPEYGTTSKSFYKLFRMFTGDSMFWDSADPPELRYYVYLMVFVIIIFFTLLNFLLAIIVNAYTVVQAKVASDYKAEMSVAADLLDLCTLRWTLWRRGWPHPAKMAELLLEQQDAQKENVQKFLKKPITIEEMQSIENVFPKEDAEAYMAWYSKRVTVNGDRVLVAKAQEA